MQRTKMRTGSGNTREEILHMKIVKLNNFCNDITLNSFKICARPFLKNTNTLNETTLQKRKGLR